MHVDNISNQLCSNFTYCTIAYFRSVAVMQEHRIYVHILYDAGSEIRNLRYTTQLPSCVTSWRVREEHKRWRTTFG